MQKFYKLLNRDYREKLLAKVADLNGYAYKYYINIGENEISDLAIDKLNSIFFKTYNQMSEFSNVCTVLALEEQKYLKLQKNAKTEEEKIKITKKLNTFYKKYPWFDKQLITQMHEFFHELIMTSDIYFKDKIISIEQLLKDNNIKNNYFYIYKQDIETIAKASKNRLTKNLTYIAKRAKRMVFDMPLFVTKKEYEEFVAFAKLYFKDKDFFKFLKSKSNIELHQIYNYEEVSETVLTNQSPFEELNK